LRELAETIETLLFIREYKWRVNGELIQPTADDVEELLTEMLKKVVDEGDVTIETGRVLIKRSGGRTDVYLHIGELEVDDA
jgi:hypothetical protein